MMGASRPGFLAPKYVEPSSQGTGQSTGQGQVMGDAASLGYEK